MEALGLKGTLDGTRILLDREAVEERPQGPLDLLVGIEHHRAIVKSPIADRQPHDQRPAPGFVEQARAHARLEDMQLSGKEGALQAQDQAVIGIAGVVNAFVIGDEGAEDRAEFQDPMPVAVEAGEPRDLRDQHEADLAQPDGGDQALKSQARFARGPGAAQILIHDHDAGVWPAELGGALGQLILAPRTLLMDEQLLGGGLPHVHHRGPIQVLGQNRSSMTHERLRCVGRVGDDAAGRPVARSGRAGSWAQT
jgi:hypothetical protein